MLGFHIVYEEPVPVQASAEVVRELHLQRLTRVFEGSKLTEEVPHLSTFTSLLKSKNPLFLTDMKPHPLLLGDENLPNDLPHCGEVDVQVPHLVFD